MEGVSWTPKLTAREERMLRAMQHLMHKNHEFLPRTCDGCMEIGGFLVVPGYEGNKDYPTAVEFGT